MFQPISRTARACGRALVALAVSIAALGSLAPAQTSRTFTTNADFEEGVLVNVNDTVVVDQLQLNDVTQPGGFPIVNVAASGRGTLIRIDAVTGAILGEYATSPTGGGLAQNPNPSRTATDADGNVWVGNRDEDSNVPGQGFRGSGVKIGLVLGGLRVDADGTPNPNGQFLQGPFAYNTCVDRDGDGLIRTSRGLNNVLAWPNVTDGAGGADGIVQDALDEAILVFQRVHGRNVHHVSIDPDGNVWTGGFPFAPDDFDLLDGATGAILQTLVNPACGGFGGVTDRNNVIWSTGSEGGTHLMRYDVGTQNLTCISTGETHGLGIARDGSIWVTQAGLNQVLKLNPDGTVVSGFPVLVAGDGRPRSVAVTPVDLHAWVDGSLGKTVTRLDPSGNLVKVVDLGLDGQSPRGMAVDSRGKVWTTCTFSNTAKRIDPSGDLDGLGVVDLTVPLGRNASPFDFSEMTGTNALTALQGRGLWQVVYDSGVVNNEYGRISWNASVPAGTSLTVEFRASDDPAALSSLPFQTAQNGVPFSGAFGQFVEIRAVFLRPLTSTATPVLFDLTIEGLTTGGPGECPHGLRVPASLLVFPEFDSRPGDLTLLTVTNTNGDFNPLNLQLFAGTVDVEFVYIGRVAPGGAPLPCLEFNRTHRLSPNDTLTVNVATHNANHEQGFVYVFAKSPTTGAAIAFDYLAGHALILNSFDDVDYSFEPYTYLGVGAPGSATDVDGDGVRDLNGVEYSCSPDVLLVPRFFGQGSLDAPPQVTNGSESELVLLNLTGGTGFTAIADFLVYNDNEEVFSAQTEFDCWVKRPLLDITGAFGQSFLAGTNHNPSEVLGATNVETGWFRVDGNLAFSSAAALPDPALLGLLVERIAGTHAACDLPWELGSQTNGDLLLIGVLGDQTP